MRPSANPIPASLVDPHPNRLDPHQPGYEVVLAAHLCAVEGDEPGYLDPTTGLFVMTASFLWARGYCCDQGCRHCPYVDMAMRMRATST